jgi:hypothetical protein
VAGRKTIENAQFARVASLGGQRVDAAGALVTLAPNDGIEPLADNEGRLIVSTAGVPPAPGFTTRFQGNAYGVIQVPVTASATVIQVVDGFQTNALTRYVQLHDIAGAIPALNVPIVSVAVPGGSEFSIAAPYEFLANGLAIGLSTTPGTFTAAAADLYTSFIFWT